MSSSIRSISFPSRVHPNAERVEDAINKLRLDCSSGHVCSSLFGLEELYTCLDEYLNLPSTQQTLSQETSRHYVDDILDRSVKIMDICAMSRDLMAEIKERVRDLLSSIRRRKGDSTVAAYSKFRNKVKKDAKRMTLELKQILGNMDQDSEPQAARVLREVNLSSCDVLKCLMVFLSSSKTPPSKWSRVSRWVHKAAAVDCEEKDDGELATVDSCLADFYSRCGHAGSNHVEKTHQTVQKQLESLELSIGSMEDRLECIFRRLIQSRASLLNIISQ